MEGIFVKFGEKEHLMQITENMLRFAPSRDYITIEQSQHNKGQGDLLDGKWKIHVEGFRMEPLEGGSVIEYPQKGNFVVSIQDVDKMPVFCLSYYGEDHIHDGKLVLTVDEYETIRHDFPKASHALIILDPDVFTEEVLKAENHKIIGSEIHYYDYDINDLRMMLFLTTGDENEIEKRKEVLAMEYGDRYRHLLCKDKDFEKQREYRFVILDELIEDAKFYKFSFKSRFMLISIEKMKEPVLLTHYKSLLHD